MRRALTAVAAALLLLGIPGGRVGAQEETEPALGGFSIATTASAVSLLFDKPSVALPSAHTFELRAAHSVAELDGGLSGRGMASVLWPGDLAGYGTPGTVALLLFNPTRLEQVDRLLNGDPARGTPGLKQRLIEEFEGEDGRLRDANRSYPIRSEAFYPAGPEADAQELGAGLRMASRATRLLSEGTATSGGGGVPGVITFGGLASLSRSTVVGDRAVSEAETRVADLDLFGGIIHADAIRSRAVARSDGDAATLEGVTEVVGLTIGTGPAAQRFVVDERGFHLGGRDEDPLGRQARQALDRLRENGITIAVGVPEGNRPRDTLEGAVGSRSVAGLVVRLEARGMQTLLGMLPAPLRAQIQNPLGGPLSEGPLKPLFDAVNGVLSSTTAGLLAAPFQFDDAFTFVFGSVTVQTAASPPLPALELPPPTPETSPPPPPMGPGSFDGGGLDRGVTVIGGGPRGGGGTRAVALRPVGVLGVPAGLVGVALAAALAGAAGLRRLTEVALGSRPGAGCPLARGGP
jgi:hypothetical protein